MKDGTEIVGEMRQLDTAKSLTLDVAGIETEISMSDVSVISPVSVTFPQTNATSPDYTAEVLPSAQYGDYVITDTAEYPDSFTISVAGQNFTMALVRGGVFNMGYDGDGSLRMDSEPVHKVKVSSYYVSREFVSEETACGLLGMKYKGKESENFRTGKWENAKQIVDKIAGQEGLPYRLVTEAEWEYAAISSYAETVFKKITESPMYRKKIYVGEWCNDVWKEEYDTNTQIDPEGPAAGKHHVARSFSPNKHVWERNLKHINRGVDHNEYQNNTNKFYVRLAISADSIKDKIKE